MKKIAITLAIILQINFLANATHNRAGEITYKWESPLTYVITLVTYTNSISQADRDVLTIQWGDGTSSIVARTKKTLLADGINKNVYGGSNEHGSLGGLHTYPGQGIYQIRMEDPNRNDFVLNIPGSVNVMFTIQTTLVINSRIGSNSAPVLLNDPVDKAALNQRFVNNPNAFDYDGDSLSYRITSCLGDKGLPIANYTRPPDSELWVDAITGDLIWDKPTVLGIFNFAMAIDEWRNGVKIGTIIRDMQIEVKQSTNEPPIIDPLKDYCVFAGDVVAFVVKTHDNPKQQLYLSATGGPFLFTKDFAKFVIDTSIHKAGLVQGNFSWRTSLDHVRKRPYQFNFKAEDRGGDLNLVSFGNVNITVMARGPKNLNIKPSNRNILLNWNKFQYSNVAGYLIYRKQNKSNFNPDTCETGVPGSTGYKLVGQTISASDTIYLDTNKDNGLSQGIEYCYRVTAVFEDGAESKSSAEVCGLLVRGIPIITKVSVEKTDEASGEIELRWIKPTEFDKKAAPGPYKYVIYQTNNLYGMGLRKIDSIMVTDTSQVFYSYRAKMLNTSKYPYSYSIVFCNNDPKNYFDIGIPELASSPFINLIPMDKRMRINLQQYVPWMDTLFVIYRQNPSTLKFDSLASTRDTIFTDYNLNNNSMFCYKIKTLGYYDLPEAKEILNFSQESCKTPEDKEPPCPVDLAIVQDCDVGRVNLSWQPRVNASCMNDIKYYKIYFSPNRETPLEVLKELRNANETGYIYAPTSTSLAGCFAVTAVDSLGNEVKKIEPTCLNNCSKYSLPNVFTPDNDNVNDLFQPLENKYVSKVDFKVYNRWGKLVFETADPQLNWDGKLKGSNSIVPDGVYYYICDVFEMQLGGMESRYISGFVYIYSNQKKTP